MRALFFFALLSALGCGTPLPASADPVTAGLSEKDAVESVKWFATEGQRIRDHDSKNNALNSKSQLTKEVCAAPVGKSIAWAATVDGVNAKGEVAVEPVTWPAQPDPKSDALLTLIKLRSRGGRAKNDAIFLPWGGDAAAAKSLKKGDPVIVTGKITRVEFEPASQVVSEKPPKVRPDYNWWLYLDSPVVKPRP